MRQMGDKTTRTSSWTNPLSISEQTKFVIHCSWLYSCPANPGIHNIASSNLTGVVVISIAEELAEDYSRKKIKDMINLITAIVSNCNH